MGFQPNIAYSATREALGTTIVYDLWQVTVYTSRENPALYEWRTGPDWGQVVADADLLNDLWSEFVAHHAYEAAGVYQAR